ncbi:Uncharacterised protein [Sphingobacterium multivorum]|uniref:hypothetical protein n=1 Tax=Sphingobacterium multivorum TaxID=28454 RepID=UPI000E083909|nr:hypothetical protein [Sphingobacterium multivorum]QQT44902.1 hypothetical protein I6J00_24935 [Sphingobacterium multivorum]SUJ18293.1 Uncharacterised protein [Sphingobacterium multivorum]
MFSQEIYNLVKKHKGCGWGLQRLTEARSASDLIRLLKSPKGVEFAMDADFLTLEVLQKYRKELESEGIYFDGVHTVVNPRFVLVLGGQVNVEMNGYEVSQIYAKRGVVKLTALENAFVTVEIKEGQLIKEVFGNAKVREFKK